MWLVSGRRAAREQPEAVELGHHHVGEDEVGGSARRLASAARRPRRLARVRRREQRRDVLAHVGVVVDDEHARPGAAPRARAARASASGSSQRIASARKPSRAAAAARRRRRRRDLVGGRCACRAARDRERAALARRALDADLAAVQAASSATSARPMPVPSWLRERRAGTRWKRSNRRACSAGSIPMPVSATTSSARRRPSSSAHRDPTLERELQRVREEVQDDLRPHVAVDVDRLRQRRAVDLEREAGALEGRAEHARELGRVLREVDRSEARVARRLEPREVEQAVDEQEQPLRRCAAPPRRASAAARSGAALVASASSAGPRSSVSGVRSSWLTFVKNAVFARSSSASCSARRRSPRTRGGRDPGRDLPGTSPTNDRYASSSAR
jgi:hypothetical protein